MSMMGLSLQSYHSTNSMTSHLLQMTSHATQSQTLATDSAADTTSSTDLHETSINDSSEADALDSSAAILRSRSEQDHAQSLVDANDASVLLNKAYGPDAVEESTLAAQIAVEETTYGSEMDKATAEGSASASNVVDSESDGVAVSMCEFIPLVDVICDFVGGIAGVSFSSNAAKLASQSALDYASAATTKAREEGDLTELQGLRAEIGEEVEVANGLDEKAGEEEAKAEAEKAEATEEEERAKVERAAGVEAEAQAEAEMVKANEEKAGAEEEMEKSLAEGMSALRDAAVAGVFSTLVVSFLSIRLVMAVVVPGTVAVVGFLPYTMSMSRQYYSSSASPPPSGNLGRNLWTALPRREFSYFFLHCGVYISTMSLWFCSKFRNLQSFDVRSRGGIIILFAVVAGCVQGLLLHTIPHFVTKLKQRTSSSSSSSPPPPSSSSSSSLQAEVTPLLPIIGGSLLKLFKTTIQLTPLFVIEITTLWLIFGQIILTFQLPPPLTPMNVGASILVAGIFYIVAFEIARDENGDESGDESVGTVCESNGNGIDSKDEEVGALQKDMGDYGESLLKNESKDGIMDETKKLLSNDSLRNKTYFNCDNNVVNRGEVIELTPPGETTIEEGEEEVKEEVKEEEKSNSVSDLQISSKDGITILRVVEEVEEGQLCSSSQTLGSNMCSSLSNSSHKEEKTVKVEEATVQVILSSSNSSSSGTGTRSTNVWTNFIDSFEQYISDLKLPFEILVITCMVVLLRGCIPTLFKLLPHVVKSHKIFFLELGAILFLICVLLWYLVRTNNKIGHIGLWTGTSLRQ